MTGPLRPARCRSRRVALLCLVATVALGLLSRRFPLPGFLAEYTGDALYTVAVFWAAALLWPTRSGGQLSAIALAFSVAVESSQLVACGWLDELLKPLRSPPPSPPS